MLPIGEIGNKDLNTYSVVQLKDILSGMQLSTEGTKTQLVNRLRAVNSELEAALQQDSATRGEKGEAAAGRWTLKQADSEDIYMASSRDYDAERHRPDDQWKQELLLRERELSEREARLLRREQDLIANRPEYYRQNSSSINIHAIRDLLSEFNGDSDTFVRWRTQAIFLCRTYDLNEDTMKMLLIMRMKGKALSWFHSKAEHLQLPVTNLLNEMECMFDQRPSKLALRKEFEKRRWQTNENFNDYFHEKLILANKISLDEEEFIDYTIDGIPEPNLRSQARLQRFKSKNDLLDAFRKMSLRPEKKELIAQKQRKEDIATHQGQPRCYNCGERGHIATNCQQPKRVKGSCFGCGSTTHTIVDCPKKKQTAQSGRPTASKSTAKPKAEQTTNPTLNLLQGEMDAPYTVSLRYEIVNEDGNICNYCINAIIDSGSPISLIKDNYVPENMHGEIPNNNISYCGINGSKLNMLGTFKHNVMIMDIPVDIMFHIVPKNTMKCAALLGRDFLSLPNINISIGKTVVISKIDQISKIEPNQLETDILQIDTIIETEAIDELNINPNVDHETIEKVKHLYETEYKSLDVENEPAVSNVELTINVKQDQPIRFRSRRIAFADKEKLKILLEQLIEEGIIRASNSPYASPIVLVRKKNGDLRLCVDYRELNKITIKENFPTPFMDDQLDSLRDKKYFSSLDLRNGFHHVKVTESSVKYTSFVTPLGQFEYLRMPFGLTNAPRVFQRFINEIFADLINRNKILLYVDDILVTTVDIEEHIHILKEVFKLARRYQLQFRLDKCFFLQQEITYLGYIVNKEGIRPSTDHLEAILNYPLPRNIKNVHSFIGLASFFRRFIKNFATIAKPLYDLLKKNAIFHFGPDELCAFETLKNLLVSQPILALYSPKLETELHCDASSKGFGAILIQKQPDGTRKPVSYFSRRTTVTESKYHSFELECLAVIYALQRFHVYLSGIHFKILTDCDSFKLTLNKQTINPRIARWAMYLQQYDYQIEHRPGTKMSHVDALSRCHNILILESNTFEQVLAIKQNKDNEICKIREKLQTREDSFFELRDDLVYRKTKNKRLLFYVPACMENNVIRTCHDDIGHIGINKVIENINRNYWFPKMHEKVKRYISNCLKCIEFSLPSGKIEGFLHPIPKGNLPFQTIHVDHYGPLERAGGFKHILCIIDAFTKFIRLYPCKSTTTEETIKNLKDYFRAYSKPKQLISDRGTCYTSTRFKEFMQENFIDHILIAVSTPRANGQIERFNRTITPMIAKLITEKCKWDKVLDCVEYALNNTICRPTQDTPSRLLYGINQYGKVNDLIRLILEADNDQNRDLNSIRNTATDNIIQNQNQSKQYYDKKRKIASTYQEGDYVMIRNHDNTPGVNKKLIPKYKGPYVIKKVLDFDRYVISDIEGYQVTQIPYTGTISSDQIKPWISE